MEPRFRLVDGDQCGLAVGGQHGEQADVLERAFRQFARLQRPLDIREAQPEARLPVSDRSLEAGPWKRVTQRRQQRLGLPLDVKDRRQRRGEVAAVGGKRRRAKAKRRCSRRGIRGQIETVVDAPAFEQLSDIGEFGIAGAVAERVKGGFRRQQMLLEVLALAAGIAQPNLGALPVHDDALARAVVADAGVGECFLADRRLVGKGRFTRYRRRDLDRIAQTSEARGQPHAGWCGSAGRRRPSCPEDAGKPALVRQQPADRSGGGGLQQFERTQHIGFADAVLADEDADALERQPDGVQRAVSGNFAGYELHRLSSGAAGRRSTRRSRTMMGGHTRIDRFASFKRQYHASAEGLRRHPRARAKNGSGMTLRLRRNRGQ